MGSIRDAISRIWRDHSMAGVAASGKHEPLKSEIRALGPVIEAAIGNAALGSMLDVAYATKAELDADLEHDAAAAALVYADATDANNDLYVKTGASGTGSWTNTGALNSMADRLSRDRESIHIDSADGTTFDIWGRELRHGGGRHVRSRIALYQQVDPELPPLDIFRMAGVWLAERGGGVFSDAAQLIDASTVPMELVARQSGQDDTMGSTGRQMRSGQTYFLDGRVVTPGEMVGFSGTARRFEIAQRSPLFEPGSGDAIALFLSRHVFEPDGNRFEFRLEIIEAFSLASLIVGQAPIAADAFDTLVGDDAWHVPIDLTGAVAAANRQVQSWRYSNASLGVGMEFAVEHGPDWPAEHTTSRLSGNGSTAFDWHDAAYSPALPGQIPGPSKVFRGAVRWRFGDSGEI